MFLAIVSVCMVLWYAAFRYRRRRMYQLAKKIPGISEIPLVGHIHHFVGDNVVIMDALCKSSINAAKQEGISKLWIGPALLISMVDPADFECVLKNCLEKDDLHRFFRELIGNGTVFAPVDIWRVRRKVIVPAFSPKIVENFVEIFSKQSEILANQLEKRVKSAGFFDVWPFMSSYTLDSVSETVMGSQIEAQTTEDNKLLACLNYLLTEASRRVFTLWLQPTFLFKLTPQFKKFTNSIKYLHNYTDNIISKKREEHSNMESNDTEVDQEYCSGLEAYSRKTFLDLLIDQSNKSKGYNDVELREEVLTLTVAGTDTSAVAMSFTLLLMGQYPDVQEKVYEEMLDIYGNSDRPLVKEDLSKMVYLDRVCKESLRLYPPVPFIARKIETEVTLPSGKRLPAGSGAIVSIWGTHRNPKYWGEDAELFDPDRFSPERYNLKHPFAYMPFSAGPRNCLGYQYAMNSMKTSLAAILRRYHITVPEESLASKSIKVKFDVMMKAAEGYKITLKQRKTCKEE